MHVSRAEVTSPTEGEASKDAITPSASSTEGEESSSFPLPPTTARLGGGFLRSFTSARTKNTGAGDDSWAALEEEEALLAPLTAAAPLVAFGLGAG